MIFPNLSYFHLLFLVYNNRPNANSTKPFALLSLVSNFPGFR